MGRPHHPRRFRRLRDFARREGHTRVTRWDADRALAHWVTEQRVLHNKGILEPDRFARLDALGFQWRPWNVAWQSMVARLKAAKAKTGDANVIRTAKGDAGLALWLHGVRGRRRRGELTEAQVEELTALGVIWDRRALLDARALAKLEAWHARHHHLLVPQREEPGLYHAIFNFRRRRDRGELAGDVVAGLDRLGFNWRAPPRGGSPDDRTLAVERFFRAHGHFDVPERGADRELAAWAHKQRGLFRWRVLHAGLERKLRALGFPLDSFEVAWEQSFAKLLAFRSAQARLPRLGEGPLGRWLEGQRSLREAGTLGADREDRLEELGAFGRSR